VFSGALSFDSYGPGLAQRTDHILGLSLPEKSINKLFAEEELEREHQGR